MIERLKLVNFKAFERVDLRLAPLTLLTGINGTGKSTALQALLALRQSELAHVLAHEGLLLNGAHVALGTTRDVRFEFAQEDLIEIALVHSAGESRWRFDASDADADLLSRYPQGDLLSSIARGDDQALELPLFDDGLMHLSAERAGPRVYYPSSSHAVQRAGLAADGLLAPAWLHAHMSDAVALPLQRVTSDDTLRVQVEAWMSEISPHLQIKLSRHAELQLTEIGYAYANNVASTRHYLPTSVGFGIAFTLPVVVACVCASPARLILIENPEAHLHPRGQMAMGELAARAAASGAQVILETHSDHVLNGVRLAVKSGALSHEHVAIHYFERVFERERIMSQPISPQIDADGRLDHWPDGFFDQLDIALERLL